MYVDMIVGMEAIEQRAEQLKALADGNRLRIVGLLAERGEVCVCEVLAALGTTQANISSHLRVLRTTGLIRGRKVGKWVFYSLERAALDELTAWLIGHLAEPAGGPVAGGCGPCAGSAESPGEADGACVPAVAAGGSC